MKYIIHANKFKVREEMNGTSSFLNLDTMKIVFLNKIANFIYLNSEINELKGLTHAILNKFEGADLETIKNDCIKVLYKMEALDIVEIEEPENSENASRIRIAGENDFKKLSIFTTNCIIKKEKVLICNMPNTKDYSVYNLRMRQFNNLENNIIYFDKNGKIDLLLTLGAGISQSVMTLSNLFAKDSDVNKIKKMIEYTMSISPDLLKIRTTIQDSKQSLAIIDLLEKLGFTLEAVLKKEYNGSDLKTYSLFRSNKNED